MMLSEGERLVIIATLQWAAMEHDKIAKALDKVRDDGGAIRAAAFSNECARLAEKMKTGA